VADNVPANSARGSWGRAGRALLVAGALAVVLFDVWLIADQDMVAMDPDDDPWFLQKARCGYWFDEGYSNYSFIFQPVYPLFVGACYRLGLPLRLGNEALYLAAAGFLSWSLVRRQTRAGVGLLVFGAVALLPTHHLMLSRVHPNSVVASLLMLALGALILQLKRRGEPGRWWRRLGSGLALGLLWNARPEQPWILGLILVFLAATACDEWRRHPAWGARARSWLGEWALPLGVLAALTLALMGANFLRWGVFAVTDLQAPGFMAAQRALTGIKPAHPLRYVPVTREALDLAYSVSPSFRELAPSLATGSLAYPCELPPGEYGGGMFFWNLREAAAAAGHCRTAPDAEAYYRRVADEINAAAAEGRLPTRWVPLVTYTGIDPCLDNWLPALLPSCRKLWSGLWAVEATGPGDWHLPVDWHDPVDYPGGYVQLLDLVACRRLAGRAPGVQSRIREWMCVGCGGVLRAALAAAGLVALAVPLLRRSAPGRGVYLLTGAVFGITGLLQFGLLVVTDASLFPANYPRYLFPASLTFTILAAWLLAEGARQLGGAVVRSFRGVPGGVRAGALRGWVTPGRRNTLLVAGVTAAAVLSLSLHSAYRLYGAYRDQPGAEPVGEPPGYREIPVPVAPVEVRQMTWKGGTGRGNDPYLVFALQQPQLVGQDPHLVYDARTPLPVDGIRLKYTYEDTPVGRGPAFFQMFWRGSDRSDFGLDRWSFRWLDVGPGERTTTVWVHDTIDQFRIHPDNKPCAFTLTEITLLVPADVPDPVARPLLRTPFARARAAGPITVETCDREDVLRVPAPSAVEFDVPARSRRSRIAGKFGILPGAYGKPADNTEGVQFAVEYTAAGQAPRVLFERFLDPQANPRDRGLQAFAVWLPPGDRGTVALRAFHPPGKNPHRDWSCWADVDLEGVLGTPFATPFARARAAEPVTVEACDGKEVLRVPAPSAVEFDVPARSRRTRIAGKFGILPGAYGREDHTDGVQFAIEYTPPESSPQVLFERFLDPQANPRDRGLQAFAVWLPPGDRGTVALRAFNPPGKNPHRDWSYWADVDLEGVGPTREGQPQIDQPSGPKGG
jgi:hypothetical protein